MLVGFLTLDISNMTHNLCMCSHKCLGGTHTHTYTHTTQSWLGLGKQLSQCCADLLGKQEQVGVSVFPCME